MSLLNIYESVMNKNILCIPVILLLISIVLLFPQNTFSEVLTLDESISSALENNPCMMIAREKMKEAEAEKGSALSSFFPKVYTSSSYTRFDEQRDMDMDFSSIPGFSSLSPVSITVTSDEIYDYNLGVTQPLFTGGKITSLYRMQKRNFSASEEYFRSVKNNLIFGVKKSYFSVLETEKLQDVAEKAVNQVRAHLGVVEDFFREGMVPEVDVLKAKVALANANHNLINANNGVELSKACFNNLLNRDMGMEVNLEDVLDFQETSFDLSSLITKGFEDRPEMGEMKNRLKMAEESVKIARSNFFPQIMLVGNWDKMKGAEIPLDEWGESWSALVQVSMDIWDWGENRNGLRKAKSQLSQLRGKFLLLRNEIELEIRKSHLLLSAARKKIKVQDFAVKEAGRSFEDTTLRFREGIDTNTDVLDAQTLLVQARSGYYRALYDYNIALAALERAIGR